MEKEQAYAYSFFLVRKRNALKDQMEKALSFEDWEANGMELDALEGIFYKEIKTEIRVVILEYRMG